MRSLARPLDQYARSVCQVSSRWREEACRYRIWHLPRTGSFSGATQAGVVGSTHARAYQVTGRFVGDTVHVTLETNLCPARHGVATRQP